MKKLKWSKKEMDLVIAIVEEAQDVANLKSWSINVEFMDGELNQKIKVGNESFVADATSVPLFEYEKTIITILPDGLEEYRHYGEDALREIVVHEVIHCLTQELFELAKERHTTEQQIVNANERLTQRVAIICTKMLKEKKSKKE